MKADSETLDHLQKALAMELAAVEQYLMHTHVAEDWGFDKLAAKMQEEMHEELGHAQAFIRRIMFLKGDPQIKSAKMPQRAQAITDMFEADLRDEKDSIKFYTEAAKAAGKAGDIGSRKLFEKIALDEEGHMSWLELQLDLIQRLGEPMFLSMQIGNPNEDGEDKE